MVKLPDTIRCLDKAMGTLIVLVAGVLEITDVGWIALVEIFRMFTNMVDIFNVWLVLLKSIVLELIAWKESFEVDFVTFLGKLGCIV